MSYSQYGFIGKTVVSVDSAKDYDGIKIVDVVLKGTMAEMGGANNAPVNIEYYSANIRPKQPFLVGYILYKSLPTINNPLQFSISDFLMDNGTGETEANTSSVGSALHSTYLNVNNPTDMAKTFYISQVFNGKVLSPDRYEVPAKEYKLCYWGNNNIGITHLANGSDTSQTVFMIRGGDKPDF